MAQCNVREAPPLTPLDRRLVRGRFTLPPMLLRYMRGQMLCDTKLIYPGSTVAAQKNMVLHEQTPTPFTAARKHPEPTAV